MQSALNLFVDTTANSLIAGLSAPQTVDATKLPIYFGDTLNLQIYLLNKTGATLASYNPYTIISTAGIQLFVYLDDGTIGGAVYTQQISFATDGNNQYFYAPLALNTMALQTLLGANTSAPLWFKIGYVVNGLITTVLSVQIPINVGLPNTSLVVPPGLTPLSVEVGNTMYVPVNGPKGQGFILTSPDGKQILLHVSDNPDGSAEFRADPIN